jgi:DNA invertase Pin-like site-specific DNA recombinase
MTTPPIPAAQYVRMSTEHQRYSIANQSAALAAYAKANGFDIIETYADAGRSGLTLASRNELQRLLSDTLSGEAPFRAVLVFDVSRWGRFQDTDESAHYEWLIRNAGVAVHYCAEQFENDGSLTSSIVKNLKRLMAAEYSRELSRKVFVGQCRLAAMGYRMGGPEPYGMRRLLIDAQGQPKALLEPGEWKVLTSDRVILVPGAQEHVAIIRRIFQLYIDGNLSDQKIAELLNQEGITPPNPDGWTSSHVRRILISEIYSGAAIFNRKSFKLHSKREQNSSDSWIRCEGAFEAIVTPETFRSAQRKREQRKLPQHSDEELLERLRGLLAQKGKITSDLIVAASDMPSIHTYIRRFGALSEAYARIGYTPSPSARARPRRQASEDMEAP